jgi:hypothetical protein
VFQQLEAEPPSRVTICVHWDRMARQTKIKGLPGPGFGWSGHNRTRLSVYPPDRESCHRT